jgi:hypothetical protein
MSKDDPDKKTLLAKIKSLDEQTKALKAKESALEADKLQHAEMVRIAAERTRADNIKEVASKYEGGDAAILKAICDKADLHDAARIKVIAGTLWKKRTQPTASIKPDSGITSGGAGKLTPEQIEKMSPEEYANHPSVKERYGRK